MLSFFSILRFQCLVIHICFCLQLDMRESSTISNNILTILLLWNSQFIFEHYPRISIFFHVHSCFYPTRYKHFVIFRNISTNSDWKAQFCLCIVPWIQYIFNICFRFYSTRYKSELRGFCKYFQQFCLKFLVRLRILSQIQSFFHSYFCF